MKQLILAAIFAIALGACTSNTNTPVTAQETNAPPPGVETTRIKFTSPPNAVDTMAMIKAFSRCNEVHPITKSTCEVTDGIGICVYPERSAPQEAVDAWHKRIQEVRERLEKRIENWGYSHEEATAYIAKELKSAIYDRSPKQYLVAELVNNSDTAWDYTVFCGRVEVLQEAYVDGEWQPIEAMRYAMGCGLSFVPHRVGKDSVLQFYAHRYDGPHATQLRIKAMVNGNIIYSHPFEGSIHLSQVNLDTTQFRSPPSQMHFLEAKSYVWTDYTEVDTFWTTHRKEMRAIRDQGAMYSVIEKPTRLPDGRLVPDYIAANTVYPEELAGQELNGHAFVYFIVNTDGTIGNLQLLKADHPTFGRAALQLIEDMPLLNPATRNGKPFKLHQLWRVTFDSEQ